MIPPQFDYHAPGSLEEALALLGRLDDAKVMSGGQSLLPMLKLRLASPANIVDIGRIPGLDAITESPSFLRIGALVTETALEDSAVVAERYPILLDTAKVIADPLVRNRATICGNVAHGDPANDHPATMLALRAQMVATGPDGERTIGVDDFFHGLFTTALTPGEILTEIRIPAPAGLRSPGEQSGARSGGAYLKLERKVGDYAVAGVAVHLALDDRRHGDAGGGRAHQPGLRADSGFGRGGGAEQVRTSAIRAVCGAPSAGCAMRSRGRRPPTRSSRPPPRPPQTPPIPSPTAAVRSNTRGTWPAC